MKAEEILADLDLRPWSSSSKAFAALGYVLGRGDYPLEVAMTQTSTQPSVADMRRTWKARHQGKPSPLLLVNLHQSGLNTFATICGGAGDDPQVAVNVEASQADRLARAALDEPDRNAAIRFITGAIVALDSDLPGLRNEGMLANHELANGVPLRPDWSSACAAGEPLLSRQGQPLVEGLGFSVEARGSATWVLRSRGAARAVAVFLDESETPESASLRFGGTSPVSHALALADNEGLPYVIVTRARQIRVYGAKPTGVGRKGRSETFVEANLALLRSETAGYLPLLFGADALKAGGTLEEILAASRDYAVDLSLRLRERVYAHVIPGLAGAVAKQRIAGEPSLEALKGMYRQTLFILFRLLFVAYAEARDLLPYTGNERYRARSLKALARELADAKNAGTLAYDRASTDLWERARGLWSAVDQGNRGWGVPPYNGGLFSTDPAVNGVGAALDELTLDDEAFGPPVFDLLIDRSAEGTFGPVDFRSLSVREFGTIYEGLLESDLSVAQSDLGLDTSGAYVPAAGGAEVVVRQGDIYLHNQSGARKASGSYFTKAFAVDHLLDRALEPSLAEHVARLQAMVDRGEEAEAASAFFDFRCADLAMGSGHFLVAAVDRIEAALSSFLALNRLPAVAAELERLHVKAKDSMGSAAVTVEIETASLLRRQVARRCVYGVDANDIAVELARLSIWIHTFVPGLPLSFLNHTLVVGNSLTGIGTLEEVVDELDPPSGSGSGEQRSFIRDAISRALDRARERLARMAIVSDADAREIAEARRAVAEAETAAGPARSLMDLAVGVRARKVSRPAVFSEADLESIDVEGATAIAKSFEALHFPFAFPEVFGRVNPGFDCIIGNPPWEKLQVEEHGFWALQAPGLRAMPIAQANELMESLRQDRPDLAAEYQRQTIATQRLKEFLASGPYPGLTAGRPDLYKAFAWRFWQLIRQGGRIGVVLPRACVSASGTAAWREAVLDGGTFEEVTMLVNSRGWVFDEVHQQFTIVLAVILKDGQPGRTISIRGPYGGRAAYEAGMATPVQSFPLEEFRTWTTGSAVPLLESVASTEVFLRLRAQPRLDAVDHPFSARPLRELNMSDDKPSMVLDPGDPAGLWPVYKGASLNLWEPDTGEYYAWAEPGKIRRILQDRRVGQVRNARSAFHGFSLEWAANEATLPCLHPRLAWRDVARATDSRTLIAALVPPNVILTNTSYYLCWPKGDARDEAFVLGLFSSIPLDWYVRRIVEQHVTMELLSGLPVPLLSRDDPQRTEVEQTAGRLAAIDERYREWASVVGVKVGALADDERAHLVDKLDAAVGLAYGLDESEMTHIYTTFHPGWRFEARLARVLENFREMTANGSRTA